MTMIWIFVLCAFAWVLSLTSATQAAKVVETQKVSNRFDVHRVKQLEIECFGEEWWANYGHKCNCGPCNPPVPPLGPGGVTKAKPRHKVIDGVVWPMPDGVPDNAHFEVIEGRWGYANHFHEGVWKWISNVHGGTMFIKVIGIGDEELTPAFKQYAAYMDGQKSLSG